MARTELDKCFDFYALGKNLLRILKLIDPYDTSCLSPYRRGYLHLMAARLLDGENRDQDELVLGLPKSAFKNLKYTSIEQARQDLAKLTGKYSLWEMVPELDPDYPETIQVSFPGVCAFTERLAKLLREPLIRRLGQISQLGMAVMVYPTATHARLEHVLGTYANVIKYCNALWNDHVNPLFRQIMDGEDLRALLCAALCHDLGQYGMAHDFEEADLDLFSHAALTARILRGEIGGPLSTGVRRVLSDEWHVDPSRVADLLDCEPTDYNKPIKFRLLHTLLDGPLDADKVDYLIRDSCKLGVPYGKGIDVERLVRCLMVIFKQVGQHTHVALGIYEKAKITAESVAFARYSMFGSVYWHHTCRCAKSMLHTAIWEALPGPDRRTRPYQEFKRDFLSFVLAQAADTSTQLDFFADRSPSLSTQTQQLSIGDLRVLQWLYQKTSDEGKRLIEDILHRKFFKRLLVVSSRRNKRVWDTLQKARGRLHGQAFRDFQRDVQGQLVALLDDIELSTVDYNVAGASSLTRTAIDGIVGRNANGHVLLLIDIPPERAGSAIELEFLSEERIRGVRRLGPVARALEDSLLWEEIGANCLESVGKIRLFVHPDIADQFEAAMETGGLKREEIEGLLTATCRRYTS